MKTKIHHNTKKRSLLTELNRFFVSKKLASTYKPTFLKCLLDIGDNTKDEGQHWIQESEKNLEVDLHFIAVRFIRYYWPLLFTFKLKQAPTPTPVAIYRLLDEHSKLFNKSQPTKKELCSDKFAKLREAVIKEAIKPQVLRKFLNDCKIYTVTKNDSITISKNTVEFMKHNKKILESASNHMIAAYLEKFNLAPNISRKLQEMQLRTTLGKTEFKEIINLQQSRCFYCNESRTEFVQEHFIPWNYLFDTQSFNIVAACTKCNSSKNDKLADEKYLQKIIDRNMKLKKIPYGYSEENLKNLYHSCRTEYHGIEQQLWKLY